MEGTASNFEGRGAFLFTVGHSNHTLDVFLGLLATHEVEVLIDVRSLPSSAYTPHFNAHALCESVEAFGIRYGFYGKELGGRPDGALFYDERGHVLYGEVARSPRFLQGLERLKSGMIRRRVAIMCSEEDPMICHRRLLVGRVLNQQGVETRHIRGDGRLQTETWADWEAQFKHEPLDLFASEESDAERERRTWKSILSVLPKRVPNSSSGE